MIVSGKVRNIVMWSGCALWVAAVAWAEDTLPTLSFDDEAEETVAAPAVALPAASEDPVPTPVAVVPSVAKVAVAPELDLAAMREKGISFLKGLAEKEGADGLISPPVRQRKVIGTTMVDTQYTWKEIDVPEYKAVKEFRNVKVGDSSTAVMVRKEVTVNKQVGTKREKRKVRDPNGEISGQEVKYEFGPGGPDMWRSFEFGYNAMAIYAMMRAGVDPQEDVVQRVAEQLLVIYKQYGLPDLTWDLAWSMAAFSMLEGKPYQEMAGQMAGKLLDGQIADGAAAGLWGPVCVNTKLLAAMIQKKTEYSEFYQRAKEKYAANNRPSYEEKAEQALDALRAFSTLMGRVAMLGEKVAPGGVQILLSDEMGMVPSIHVLSYPSWIFNQCSSDMESTVIAMFGLRVAAERNLLPKEIWRPKDERGRPLIPAFSPGDVLKLAVSAIRDTQRREGWSELNRHQRVVDFDKMQGISGVPGDASSFLPLPDPLTPLSTVQGYAVFSYYAAIRGVADLSPFARNVVAGNASVKTVLDAGFTEPKGAKGSLCDLCFYLSETPDLGNPEYDLQAREPILAYLASSQNEDGSWGRGNAVVLPSSLRARREILPVAVGPNADRTKAHVAYRPKEKTSYPQIQQYYVRDTRIVNTAYALLALAAEL